MLVVYDWVGFFSLDIENFILCDFLGEIFLLSVEILDRCIIIMVKVLQIFFLFDLDNEIQFQGFGDISVCSIVILFDFYISKGFDEGKEGKVLQ